MAELLAIVDPIHYLPRLSRLPKVAVLKAVGETLVLLHPPLPLGGVSIGVWRGRSAK